MYVIDPLKCYLTGGAAIVSGVIMHTRKKQRLKLWIPTTGSVQNVRRSQNGDAVATVRFTDQSGGLQTASMKVADGDDVSLGADLEISYNPRKPEEAFIRDAKDMNLSLYIPLVAGVLLLVLGVVSQITMARAGVTLR